MEKVQQRTCMGCNIKKDKKEFIRIVRTTENTIEIDKTYKKDGRGAYLCKEIKCLEKVKKTRRLERSLKTNITEEQYEKIRGVIIGE